MNARTPPRVSLSTSSGRGRSFRASERVAFTDALRWVIIAVNGRRLDVMGRKTFSPL
jgi:hypothetical protein